MKAFLDYLSKVKLEFSKISWLKGKELTQLMITVLVITIVAACFFSIVDMIASSIIMKIIFW